MRRREFLGVIGGAAVVWPVVAWAQQAAVPVVGFLRSTSPDDSRNLLAAFRQGLNETGFVEGQNVAIEYRWAENQNNRLPALADDLVRRQVGVILAGSVPAAIAAKAATSTIPIVFSIGSDPTTLGLVDSLSRPSGNVTGVSFLSAGGLGAKRLELLRELVPKQATVAFLGNQNSRNGEAEISEIRTAARSRGVEILIINVGSDADFESIFATFAHQHVGALVVGGDALFLSSRDRLVALVARLAIPTSYQLRDYVDAGGLMSYGASIADTYRQAGVYAGQILKGAKPSELPVLLPTKFDFVLNLKTAKALGLSVPDKLLALADEVIE